MERALGSRYLLAERLGGGGMGTVYRAIHRDGGPDRAVKLLRAELAEDPVILARFVQEHSLMLKLRGPHLVAVEDLIVDGDHVGIVMELVSGGTLRRLAESRGPLAAPVALGFIRQILLGLDVVHAHGIVHRDVKPENVLLDATESADDPVAKVSDFGIARLVDGPRLTGTFNFIGTAHYCPPEIPEGATPTPAADIYASGVVLYQLLTGSTPFAGLTPYALIIKQAGQPPPRSPLIADAVWTMLARWLTADPAARPPDARQALLEVDDLLKLLQPPATAWGGAVIVPTQTPAVVQLPDAAENAPVRVAKAKPPAGRPPQTLGLPSPAAAPDHLQIVHEPPPTEPIPWVPFRWDDDRSSTGGGSTGVTAPVPRSEDGSWPGGVPDVAETAAEKMRPHRPNAIFLIAGVIVVAGLAAGTPALLSSSKSGSASTPALHFTLRFPTEVFPESGVTLNRTWRLDGGDHPMLHAVLVFHTTKATAAQVDEVLPKGLAANVSAVTFKPQPKVIQADPVVRYSLPTVAGVTVTDRYDVPVSSSDLSLTTLQSWAAQQSAEAGLRYRTSHQLSSLSLGPGSVKLTVGSTTLLRVSGKQSDGSLAPTVAFGGAAYSVDQPAIAAVASDGTLRGVSPGHTTVRVRIGSLAASEPVTVIAAGLSPSGTASVPGTSGTPTTGAPTSAAVPTTVPESSASPTIPGTLSPTTLVPTTLPPVTAPPTTEVPPTKVPPTEVPPTEVPPTSDAPVSEPPPSAPASFESPLP